MIRGLTRIRNEEHIIKDTLDRWGEIVQEIYVYDDCSTDRTVEICKAHPKVKGIIEGKEWDRNRENAEYQNRRDVLNLAKQNAQEGDWYVYFDADEHPYLTELDFSGDAIALDLYDVHITPEDVKLPYTERKWVDPSPRTIIFFFKEGEYSIPDQREPLLPQPRVIKKCGRIKHYGKGFSVEQWEDTCDYYINHFPKYAEKWKQRKGKAVKYDMLSDFGQPLIKF